MAGESILLAENDPTVLRMLNTVLDIHGYAVTTARSGADARQKLDDGAFDLVLTDMRMETETAGLDVVRAASSKPGKPAIMILTAFPLLTEQWRNAGAHRVLSKPIGMGELLTAIEKLLAERHERQAAMSAAARHFD